ncbi:MAG TPA: histidinol-phosphatase [Bacteroidales bacterium]|nr:histidinol-phosphatase [Bacteroidales bacterium]
MGQTNLHSHTQFSDGSDEPEKYVLEAVKKGMSVYGFSCHAPLPFETTWSMKESDLNNYRNTIRSLKLKYKDKINILAGLEIDYLPERIGYFEYLKRTLSLDYTIGSVHIIDQLPDGTPWNIDGEFEIFEEGLNNVFGNDIRLLVKRYYELIREMVSEEKPDIIGHIDKIKQPLRRTKLFNEAESWYRDEVLRTLDLIAETKCIVEINTRGFYKGRSNDFYPSNWIISAIREKNIPVMTNSDAHRPEEIVAGLDEADLLLSMNGYTETAITPDSNGWKMKKILL